MMYGVYPFKIDDKTKKTKIVVFEKYDNNINLVNSNANIAINKEFVGYLGIKIGANEDLKSASLNVSIILYDVRTQQDTYKAV